MAAQPIEPDDDLDDLLTDDLRGPVSTGPKIPVKQSAKALAKQQARAAEKARADSLAAAENKAKAQAARLAQIVNLHIAGFSFAEIGASIGATADEVERMINAEAARYVRTQPALRNYVRGFISGRITELLDNVWDRATDDQHPENLEAHDRAAKRLVDLARLHGAEAPVQKEVKIESSPEAVEKLVDALAQASGRGYDMSIFDVVETEVGADGVHRAVGEAAAALEVSGNHPDFDEESGEPL